MVIYTKNDFSNCYKNKKSILNNSKNHFFLSNKVLEKKVQNFIKTIYELEPYHRSNQDTCLIHRPAVFEGQWIESGDLLADCASSLGGELSLGQNLLVGYMPWEGFNYEDAILISQRLVYDDIYTSIHIEKYEIEVKDTLYGPEEITKQIPIEIHESSSGAQKEYPIPINRTNFAHSIKSLNSNQFGFMKRPKYFLTEIKRTSPYLIQRKGPSLQGTLSTGTPSIKLLKGSSGVLATIFNKVPLDKRFFKSALDTKALDLGKNTLLSKNLIDINRVQSAQSFLEASSLEHLDENGVAKLGSWIEEGTILVGKITPLNVKEKMTQKNTQTSPYQKLLYNILDKKEVPFRDSSVRAPKGIRAKVIDIQVVYKKTPLQVKKQKVQKKKKSGILTEHKLLQSQTQTSAPKVDTFVTRRLVQKKICVDNDFKANVSSVDTLNNFFKPKDPKINALVSKNHIKKSLYTNSNRALEKKEANYTDKILLEPIKLLKGPSDIHLRSFLKRDILLNNLKSEDRPRHKNSKKAQKKMNPNSLISPFLVNSKSLSFGRKAYSFFKKKKSKAIYNHQEKAQSKDLVRGTLQVVPNQKALTIKKDIPSQIQKIQSVKMFLAEKRRIQVGDKMSGRHGNKGIVSQILPIEDMPFLPDGTALDILLNPLGVPSRMNVGQIYECLLGLAGKYLGEHYSCTAFDEMFGSEASRSYVLSKLFEARKKTGLNWLLNSNWPGKIRIFDGRTGDSFDQPITVGQAYMLRLVHMVDDKIHSRSTGPYSLVTQQPLRGRSKQGGQRLGEMEVWALEGYGAAFTLLEMLTLKSDDMTGRMTLWSNLILNKDIFIGTPESFKVLVSELQALCLDVGLFKYDTSNIGSFNKDRSHKKVLKEIENLMNLP